MSVLVPSGSLSRANHPLLDRSSLVRTNVHLGNRERLVLPADGEKLDGAWRKLNTTSLLELKQWIGFDDEAIRSGRQIAADVPLERILRLDPADPRLAPMIDDALRAYLFGDSTLVANYRAVIEYHRAPFEAQMISLGRVVLERGSELAIDTLPVVLLIDELIFRGGGLYLSSGGRVVIGKLTKEEEVM